MYDDVPQENSDSEPGLVLLGQDGDGRFGMSHAGLCWARCQFSGMQEDGAVHSDTAKYRCKK